MSARGAVKIMQTARVESFINIKQRFMKFSATLARENFGKL